VGSGFALPMIITVACAAAVMEVRLPLLLLAAIASLTLLIQESALALRGDPPNLFAAGLLGALLFGIALGIRELSQYLRTSERQRALQESETARLERLNELIIQRMRTGLVVVDRHGIIALINRAAVDLLGGHREQRPLVARQPLSAIAELYQPYQRWKIYPWQQPAVFAVGSNELQPSFAPLEQGENGLTLIFLEDNRAQMQRAQQLKLASLGKLTAGIAHEIRNPLGAVSHAAQLLAEQCAAGTQAGRLAEIVVTHTGRINDIVENVLQLSRQRPAEGSRFDLNPWLRDFAAEFAQQPGAAATLPLEAADGALRVEFDPSHLRQILTNLLDNALRHSETQCGQRWALLRTGIDGVSGRPWLDVVDRGPGIAAADREHLFEPFFTKSHQGTGLGLYISRELCEMNRATLEYRRQATGSGADTAGGACFRIGFAHPDRSVEPPRR
jgi:two-component system sensor histidine kinase PilS (NtrC family)